MILGLGLIVSNKAKGRTTKRVLQEDKARQIFRKMNIPCYTRFVIRSLLYYRRNDLESTIFQLHGYVKRPIMNSKKRKPG